MAGSEQMSGRLGMDSWHDVLDWVDGWEGVNWLTAGSGWPVGRLGDSLGVTAGWAAGS